MAQTTDDIIKAMESDVTGITSKMIADLIANFRNSKGKDYIKLWKRYTLEDVPIYHHKVANYTKVNELLANDFYADIVDTKTGYMGNEVTTSLNREKYKEDGELNEKEYQADREHLRDFQIRTSSEDLNSEMVGLAGSTGIGYRLLWSKDNIPWTMNLDPWEVIYIFDPSVNEAVAAIRFFVLTSKEFGDSGKTKEITVVEWYDKTDITYYIDNGDMNFHIDTSKGTEGTQPHLFTGVPIIPFPNNGLEFAEPQKVTSLIDGYDTIISATTSEIEQLRLAYMFLKGSGMAVDDLFIKSLEQTGILPLESDGEAGFINKVMDMGGVKIILDELRINIYEFSKSIDKARNFGGDMRVIGWQVALLNMENSSIVTERKFKKALREQYRMLTDYWKKFQGVTIDPMSIEYTFTRNFPRDIQSEAETLNLLLDAVSTETAYSQMSFIDDPEAEIKKKAFEDNPFLDGAETAGAISLGGEEDIQKKAFNGAQVTALKDIVQAVSAGELTADAAIDLILVAFPDIGEEVARKMIRSAGSIKIDGN